MPKRIFSRWFASRHEYDKSYTAIKGIRGRIPVQMKLLFALAVLLPYASLEQYSAKDNAHYVAAVVEYTPEVVPKGQGATLESELDNIQNYEELVTRAKSQGADIIVFPEDGLTWIHIRRTSSVYHRVPHPRDSVCPCSSRSSDWDEPLRRMSCAARDNQIYVVFNIREKSGSNRHNTNVVFDRDGVVVSRYRKMHLFGEPDVKVPLEKDFSVFQTDFGVTFGVVICFDLLFQEQASELVHTRNIRHFVFSSAWFSELPFLTAVQTQASWAYSHNSVLLASGLNTPKLGSTGSGIYAGRMGPIKTTFTDKLGTQLLIGRVPKNLDAVDDSCAAQNDNVKEETKSTGTSFTNLHLMKDWIHAFSTQLLPLEGTEGDTTLCFDDFCCHFNIRATLPASNDLLSDAMKDWQPYRLFVWNGVRDFAGVATGGVQFCAVVACRNAIDVNSCGETIPADLYRKVQFSKIQIRGDFERINSMVLANTLNQDLQPLPTDTFDFREIKSYHESTENLKTMKMALMKKRNDIQTFAIYNRVFNRDGSNYTHTKS